ncbi:hypothetical protein KC842_00895 [Candidatus Nomurabacteria bacterium]|nr:hypothetical protein [Candidatus Nomurabacteria bacterium]USN95038.1 MAG: hypothetical protein H6791_01240 [Candidatus Nomurabacteria bacterium]
MNKKFLTKILGSYLVVVMAFGALLLRPEMLIAASVTSLRDVLSTLTASTAANHTIYFVTPSGVAAGETITVTFDSDFTGLGSIVEDDVDFAEGDSGTCTTAGYTEKTTAASASGTTWGVSIASQTITITSGTDTVTAARCVRIEVGTNATSSGTGANQISNGVAGNDHSITIGGTFGDSGTAAIDIIADDSVNITATVDPSITFTVDDTTVGFGTLSASTGRWATGDTNGTDASETTPTAAHTMTVGTNASSGYSITYNGATLTSGANTIDVASVTGDGDGTPGTEEFGLSVSTDGDATIASGYQRDATPDFAFVASTATEIVSETGPTATETLSVSYLANISSLTEAGSYSTDVTYIATAAY